MVATVNNNFYREEDEAVLLARAANFQYRVREKSDRDSLKNTLLELIEYTPKQLKLIKKFKKLWLGHDPKLFTTLEGLMKQIDALDKEGYIYYLYFSEYEDKPNKWYDIIGHLLATGTSHSMETFYVRKKETVNELY